MLQSRTGVFTEPREVARRAQLRRSGAPLVRAPREIRKPEVGGEARADARFYLQPRTNDSESCVQTEMFSISCGLLIHQADERVILRDGKRKERKVLMGGDSSWRWVVHDLLHSFGGEKLAEVLVISGAISTRYHKNNN